MLVVERNGGGYSGPAGSFWGFKTGMAMQPATALEQAGGWAELLSFG
jgi:hypothetical protein